MTATTTGTATLRRKPANERTIRVSIYGSGREHWHVILSKSRGLDRVLAVATFDTLLPATERAGRVAYQYQTMGFTARELGTGTYLELSKSGETASYLTTRRCDLKHSITG